MDLEMRKLENIHNVKFDKKTDVHNIELLPVVSLPVYREIVKEMAELIEDKQTREVFCSLSSGEDLQSVSRITGISSKNLVSMYKRGIRQIHLKWRPYSELKRELDHMYIKYRNNEFLLTHSEEVPKKNFRYVKIVWKEQDIPAEYVDLLITPLSKLDINFRVLRALRKYNIYQLEDLLRFIKYNGFDALYQMPSVGTKSIEQLYEKLKDKKILEDQDTCFFISLSFLYKYVTRIYNTYKFVWIL